MKKYSPFLTAELSKIDQIICEAISSKIEKISLISDYIINAGGKRIRPILAILAANLFKPANPKYIHVAAAVEFIHTATLLHDDVVDGSVTRRGKQVANLKWGNKEAILVGDFLFSQSFKQMALTDSMHVIDTLAHASTVIAEGEVDQLEHIYAAEMSSEKYMSIIAGKTAELFAAACKCGAIINKQSEEKVSYLYTFGFLVGIAFQIIDDVLDYMSSDTGKDLGNDFKEGKVTLPVILAIEKASESDKEILRKIFSQGKPREDFYIARSLIETYGGFKNAKAIAKEKIQEATEILTLHFPESEAKSILLEIISKQISRIK